MTRHFFISNDLDDLEALEEDLEREGLVTAQIHVLSLDDSGVANHQHLHAVTPLMKKDIVHSALLGAALGACVAALILFVAYWAGWTESAVGWIPFVFLAIIALGFFTWEGGLRGIETPNVHFRRFEKALEEGRHVFFVDLDRGQDQILQRTLRNHPTLEPAGVGSAPPRWLVFWPHRLTRFFVETFP